MTSREHKVKVKTILFSSVGRRAALVNIFREEAQKMGEKIRIVGLDYRPDWSPACHLCDTYYAVPKVTDPLYLHKVQEICQIEKVSLLVPTIDPELIIFARAKQDFYSLGIRVVISSENAVETFRDKLKTADFFIKNNIPSPRTLLFNKDNERKIKLDGLENYIAKPINGSCSQGLMLNLDAISLSAIEQSNQQYILQEKLYGKEYTVNCFANKVGELVSATPHFRYSVRAGEVCFAVTERVPQFERIAEMICNSALSLDGPFCFQGIIDKDGEAKIFELNPRFGGGYPVAHYAGNTIALWLLEEVFDLERTYKNIWKAGVKMLRYDAAVFL